MTADTEGAHRYFPSGTGDTSPPWSRIQAETWTAQHAGPTSMPLHRAITRIQRSWATETGVSAQNGVMAGPRANVMDVASEDGYTVIVRSRRLIIEPSVHAYKHPGALGRCPPTYRFWDSPYLGGSHDPAPRSLGARTPYPPRHVVAGPPRGEVAGWWPWGVGVRVVEVSDPEHRREMVVSVIGPLAHPRGGRRGGYGWCYDGRAMSDTQIIELEAALRALLRGEYAPIRALGVDVSARFFDELGLSPGEWVLQCLRTAEAMDWMRARTAGDADG